MFRMRNSSNSKRLNKAQFFILSAFVMVTILFVISQFIQPSGIFDTSSAVLMDEIFTFNNIKEKTIELVKISDSCSELNTNLEEYRQFVESFVTQKNARLVYNFDISQPCDDSVLTTDFYIAIVSPRASADSTFTASKI